MARFFSLRSLNDRGLDDRGLGDLRSTARFASLRSLDDRRLGDRRRLTDLRLRGRAVDHSCGRPRLAAAYAREAAAQHPLCHVYFFRASRAAITCGTTVNRSPTMPKSATSKMGASASLLIATMVFAVCMPARC